MDATLPNPMANMLGSTDGILCPITYCELTDVMSGNKYNGGGITLDAMESYRISF